MVERLLRLADSWRGAALLFSLALAAYWLQALAWPLQRGRDSWDYWLYFLQLLDREPPFSALQVFRTPVAPLLTGAPMSIGGAQLLEVVMALTYAGAVVGWAWAARPFGRLAAVATGLVVLIHLPYAALFHQVSSDFVFAALLAPWAGLVVRAVLRSARWTLVGVGLGAAILTLTRPANQVLVLAVAAVALVAPGSWRRRSARLGIALAAMLVPLALWAGHNALRYDDFTAARGGKAWVPFFKVAGSVDPANGPASRRLANAVQREVLTLPAYRRHDVDVHTYFRGLSNFEVLRLIALSDSVFGWSSDYDVLFDASVEAVREDPGAYADAVGNTFWDFLTQRYALGTVRKDEPIPRGPATILVGDKPMPSPEALSPLVSAVRYGLVWCPTDDLERCLLRDPSAAFTSHSEQARYRELTARIRDWNAELPLRDGNETLGSKLATASWRFPRAILWLAVAVLAIAVRRPRGWPALAILVASGLLVLAVHALSQSAQNEFAIPVMPLFVLAAVCGLAGERGGEGLVREER